MDQYHCSTRADDGGTNGKGDAKIPIYRGANQGSGGLGGQFNRDESTNRYQLIKQGNGVIAIWMAIEMWHFNYSEDIIIK